MAGLSHLVKCHHSISLKDSGPHNARLGSSHVWWGLQIQLHLLTVRHLSSYSPFENFLHFPLVSINASVPMKTGSMEQCDLISSVSTGLQGYNFSTVWIRKLGGQRDLHLNLIEKKNHPKITKQKRGRRLKNLNSFWCCSEGGYFCI